MRGCASVLHTGSFSLLLPGQRTSRVQVENANPLPSAEVAGFATVSPCALPPSMPARSSLAACLGASALGCCYPYVTLTSGMTSVSGVLGARLAHRAPRPRWRAREATSPCTLPCLSAARALRMCYSTPACRMWRSWCRERKPHCLLVVVIYAVQFAGATPRFCPTE